MVYLGIDIGTSSLKITLINEKKEVLFEGNTGYRYVEPQEGYRELDPSLWYEAACQMMQKALRGTKFQEVMIGITGQMHTTVFLDDKGDSVRPAIMWNDLRTAAMIPGLRKELTNIAETTYIARILSTGSPFVNILWLKEQEPENFKKVRRIMTAYDYLIYKFTGAFSCDYCAASTSAMYDIVLKKWSRYMLEKAGIDESFFGKLHTSCDVVGYLHDDIRQRLKLSQPVKVIAGTGDNSATAAALGITEREEPAISLGTSGVIILAKKDGDFEGCGKNVLFKTEKDTLVNIVQGTVQSAGGTHRWWLENILKTTDMACDQEEIAMEKLGDNTILFFPHLSGDKTIYHDPDIRGAFIGLSTRTTRRDMTQAVLEGIGFGLREVLERMAPSSWPHSIQVNGGGSRSALWMQILADILHMRVEVAAVPATPGYGVCMLAMMADNNRITEEGRNEKKIYRPDEGAGRKYDIMYEKYKKIYRCLNAVGD